MVVSLKSKNKKLEELCEAPFLGAIIAFLIALLPVPLLFIIDGVSGSHGTAQLERINALITGLWNVFLTFGLKIKISIFFIPCWILFLIIGVLRFFQLLD